ncbi:hypothetical protein PENTCL1PPCAC_10013, partial [Pristionchus entomophagus]
KFYNALICVALALQNHYLFIFQVRFISRFAHPSRTMVENPAYFLTNVSGALQIIIANYHESLKMSRDEFEAYTSGELAPPLNKGSCG